MGNWDFSRDDLKKYPHFDAPLSVSEARALAFNPERVSRHTFYPFLLFKNEWWPFGRKNKAVPQKKSRKIRYAARGDAYIYAYYRHVLSEKYEERLVELGISECVIAYRKIPIGRGSRRGKNNIHFAAEAFDTIYKIGNCCAVALDISKFFESIDHEKLKTVWCGLLGVEHMPNDHWAVFKNITRYAEVDRNEAYQQLGFAHRTPGRGWEYLRPKNKMPIQLCSPQVFRKKIVDAGLIIPNKNSYGIPQGAPISDLLANAYLMEFDSKMAAYAFKRGGRYMRYSDDILIILPGDGRAGAGARKYASTLIKEAGERLVIKPEKASTIRFTLKEGRREYVHIDGHRSNGLEYLGFRFDGTNVYLRDSTLSNLNRKISRTLHAEAVALARRYPGKDETYLLSKFNLSTFLQRFGRVEDFVETSPPEDWTFWTYARRANRVFGTRGRGIFDQLKRQRVLAKRWADDSIRWILKKGVKPKHLPTRVKSNTSIVV